MSSKEPISRNAPCPCGSGKKYKACCGSLKHSQGSSPAATSQDPGKPSIVPGKSKSPPPKQQMYAEATRLVKAGQTAGAKEKYEGILARWPAEAYAVSGLARCLIQLGQSEAGLKEARRAVALKPNDLICINELTVTLFNLGKVEEALKWAKRAVKIVPDGDKTYVLVANCYEKLHRIEDGLKANRLAQIANPQVKYLKLQEAKLLARKGEHQQAIDILRETTLVPGLPAEVRSQVFGEIGRAHV